MKHFKTIIDQYLHESSSSSLPKNLRTMKEILYREMEKWTNIVTLVDEKIKPALFKEWGYVDGKDYTFDLHPNVKPNHAVKELMEYDLINFIFRFNGQISEDEFKDILITARVKNYKIHMIDKGTNTTNINLMLEE